jgi:hypothetical protein
VMAGCQRILPIVAVVLLTSCMESEPSTELRVCVDSTTASAFTERLGGLLKRYGFTVARGRAVDEHGNSNFVLEAKHGNVRVWAQNAPLNPPSEVSNVENYSPGLGIDPNEYFVSVQARLPVLPTKAKTVFARLRSDLLTLGYREASGSGEC